MAGKIPQPFIDELLSRIDIVDVINSRLSLRKAGREFTACCPFHDEKTPSFTVSQQKQFYHCFGCGAHGNALSFLMEFEHAGFVEAVEDLSSIAGLEVPREQPKPGEQAHLASNKGLYALLERAVKFYRSQLAQHAQASSAIEYLKQRGLNGEIAREFEVGYAPPGWDSVGSALKLPQRDLVDSGLLIEKEDGGSYDRFRDRVMFPIRDARGRVIGFGGRVLGDDTPKYLNSPETAVFHKGRELYGLFQARKSVRKLECLIVVEGYMDVVALAQFGVRNCVATLGTATTQAHLERMFRIVGEVVFCFDGDRAGREAAERALNNSLGVMREGWQLRFMFLPDGEDPDSLVRREGAEAFELRVKEAQSFSEFFYDVLIKQVDVESVSGRAKLVDLARPLLAQLRPGVLRQMMQDELARLAKIAPAHLGPLLGGTGDVVTASRKPAEKEWQNLSLVRRALLLLLNLPSLAQKAGDGSRFRSLTLPGMPLLCEVLSLLNDRPDMSPGALVEHWRDHDNWRHLVRLMKTPMVIGDTGIEEEFDGVLSRFDAMLDEQRVDELCGKEQMSHQEKQELSHLLLKLQNN